MTGNGFIGTVRNHSEFPFGFSFVKRAKIMTIPGGWSVYTSDISSDARTAFDQAMKGLMGVSYTPVAVAQQVVAGMNYRFICNASAAIENPTNFAAVVSVFKPLNGPATRSGIEVVGKQ